MGETKMVHFSGVAVEFALCPSGSFSMGSDSGLPLETPVHNVSIDTSFWISTKLVTQQLWLKVMATNPSAFTCSDSLPVDGISYDNANTFCDAVNAHSNHRIRLPSEAEWEFACRAGTTTEYFWGASEAGAVKYAWYSRNAREQTQPVAELAPNPWGLYDMVGNLWEWCDDVWHSNYNDAPITGDSWLLNAHNQSRRCLRGGAWDMDVFRLRSAYRSFDHRELGISRFGLRVVLAGQAVN